MVALLHQITRAGFQAPAGLASSELARFMSYVVERSSLNHYQAYRLSRVFDEMELTQFTQQRATFERVAEHRTTLASDCGWDEALRQWITVENQARVDRTTQHGVNTTQLPTPSSLIATNTIPQS